MVKISIKRKSIALIDELLRGPDSANIFKVSSRGHTVCVEAYKNEY